MKNKKLWSWLVIITLVIGLMPNVQYVSAETKTTQYEAEDSAVCDSSTANKIHTGTSNASGGKAATMYTGKYVTFTVSVEEAGTYDVVMNMAANSNPAGSTVTDIPMEVTVNDGTAQALTITNNKNYNSFTQYIIALELVAGTNTIVVKNVCEDATIFVNLDYISITEGEEESVEETSTVEVVIPDAIGRHEAENANYGDNTLQNGDWYASTSNGAVVGLNGTWEDNEYKAITWTVNAAEAGTYTLTVAYCTTSQVELKAKVNDGNWTLFNEADASTLVLPATANWNVAGTATLDVELVEGNNTIMVSGPIVDWNANWSAVYNQTGWPSGNIDYIELAKKEVSDETTTPEPVVVPDAVGRHEAENAEYGDKTLQNDSYYASCSNGAAVALPGVWEGNDYKPVTFTVNATEAGKYTLSVAYCTTTQIELKAQVNGGEWKLFNEADASTFVLPPSAGWNVAATATLQVELVEGTNTIAISCPIVDWNNNWNQVYGGTWGPSGNLDYIELAKAEEETTTPEPEVTKYEVSVDGTVVAEVEEGQTYTLGDAVNGYVCGDNAYKAGTVVTVTENMAFTSIGDVTVTAQKGAGIRYNGTAGIRFQATVNAPKAVLNSAAVTTGTIITAKDIYDVNGQVLTLDVIADKNEYAALNVVNNGWYNDVIGTYCGSVVDIADSNYIREFIAVAYATITYTDGTAATVYSDMTGARSIKGVAQAVKDAGYIGIDAAYHAVIDAFAVAK